MNVYRYVEVKVRVSELTTLTLAVAEWELPVLQAVHGNALSVSSNLDVTRRKPVDPADEFQRLANRYKSPEIDAPPYVAAVYGAYGPGVSALAQAIEKATVPAKEVPSSGKRKAPASDLLADAG